MKCPVCSFENAPGARFCEECGRRLDRLCPSCGQPASPQAKFCRECGYSLAAGDAPAPSARLADIQQAAPAALQTKILSAGRQIEGERKLVTVLFADIVGSTAFAEKMDPEEWREVVTGVHQHVSEAIYRYEGTIAQLLGDGVLAFFGAPLAHEDDAERAVCAALDIQAAMGSYGRELAGRKSVGHLQMRVGVNSGLVVVGSIGNDLHMEYLAIGDTVNLAARLQTAAEPGAVLISASTARQVKHAYELESRGPLELKGKAEPVPAFQVVGRKAVPEQARGIEGLRAPLIGRDREMGLLRGAIADLVKGRGQVLSIMGEAGLGKSRLIAEVHHALVAEGMLPGPREGAEVATSDRTPLCWFEGRCLSYQSSTPYAPFIALLNSCLGVHGGDPDAEKCNKVTSQVARVFPEGVMETVPFIATMLGIQLEGEEWERVRYLEPPQVRERVFRAVPQYLERVAAAKPLVLVFEDLHWADSISLDLLQQLMPLTDRVPLMLIGVFRPWRQEPSWGFHEAAARDYPHRYTSLLLEPLTESDARTLVANLLHIEDLPEKVRELILTKTEGNPFFVEEVIRSLLDARLVVRENSHWRATKEIETIAVPNTLAGVIQSRLDRLDGASKQAVQAASVIGREFSLEALEAVSERRESLEEALAELQRRELVREKSRLPRRVYMFKHVLTQEEAYASLLLSTRRQLHRRQGEYLARTTPASAAETARHFLEAREEARALPHLVRAGEGAAFACSLKEALTFFGKAVDILESVREVSLARRAYEGLGSVLALSFDIAGAVECFHKMIHVAETYDNAPMKVSALNKLARITALMKGQFPEAEVHLREAERLALLSEDLPGLTELHMSYCAVRTISGDIDGALDHQKRALQIGNDKVMTELRLFGMSHCANSLTFMTRFDEAWHQAKDALAAAEKAGDRRYVAQVLSSPIPWYHLRLGQLEAARKDAQRGTDLAGQIGAEDTEGMGAYLLGNIARLQGRYEEAMALQRRAIRAGQASGMVFVTAGALCSLGSLSLEIGEKHQDQAGELHSQSLKLMEHIFGLVLAAQSWTDMGFWALSRGQVNRSRELFQKALTERSTVRYLVRPAALVGMALATLVGGDIDEAARLAAEARAFAEERTMRLYYPLIARGEGRVAEAKGDTEKALERYAEAEGLALEMGMRPMVWQAQAEAARSLAATGRQEEAVAMRRKAQAMIEEIAALLQDPALRAHYVESATNKLA
ncbi:MAG: AAA family ATPase [Chloroflexi bacterium]|nr:AAA family ATPase [Chloroflexota bacterium]